MDLRLPAPPAGFKAPGRIAGVVTEAWAAREMFCPACPSPRLTPTSVNTPVVDLVCPRCSRGFNVKAKKTPFTTQFRNSAYDKKIEAIRARRLPDYALVRYDAPHWRVVDLEILPGHFVTESSVTPSVLGPHARRAGHKMSNVSLKDLPGDARVAVVRGGQALPPSKVRREYGKFAFLADREASAVGWLADVLREVRSFERERGPMLPLKAFYDHAAPRLSASHPENRHVEDKIRQQLQVLVARGVLDRAARGHYRILS